MYSYIYIQRFLRYWRIKNYIFTISTVMSTLIKGW